MGNCTSKKSRKSFKLDAKSLFPDKMDKDQDPITKGLSKKIAPFTKGEVTSFGFRKKALSQLPVPITLTSNGNFFYDSNEKSSQNGVANHKSMSDGYHSGSSVESLCHAPFRSTPKMVRKRDLVQRIIPSPAGETEPNAKNVKPELSTVPVSLAVRNGSSNGNKTNSEAGVNRFGFRQPTPLRAVSNPGKSLKKSSTVSRTAFLMDQDGYETGSHTTNKKVEVPTRSRSEGAREAFFKETLQPADSVQSGLHQSKASLSSNFQPGKFTFQTSHLPRPQFPQAVRMSDTKTTKTAVNYFRKGGARNYSNSFKNGFTNEDSGFESHSSANNTLERHIEILESSPGSKVRRHLPTFKGKKLEMKIVGNKFELLNNDDEGDPDVVTEISLIKLPTSNSRNSAAVINTGLVEQRTSQYLKKVSQSFNKKETGLCVKDLSKLKRENVIDCNNRDEGLGAESEEEKLFKDSKGSEKSSVKYIMTEGCGDSEDILPGETMAEDLSLCLSFEEELSSRSVKKLPAFVPEVDVTPNTIRLDALKLSKELKWKNSVTGTNPKGEDSSSKFLAVCEKDEDTFPSDSILEQLSDSDSLGDKGEDKNNDKEKSIKAINLSLEKEDLGIELDEEDNSKGDTDVDDNDLEMNLDVTEIKDDNKNCLGTNSPASPGTPTPASNSLSLSDGRDFLIDDEIADQPQLCLSESYVDCSCKEEPKTTNEKTVTVNELVTCCNVHTSTNGGDENESLYKINENGNRIETRDVEVVGKIKSKDKGRLNSEGTLSSCESITSDDLMLDFEMNSLEETAGRFDVNENISVENLDFSTCRDEIVEISRRRLSAGSGGETNIKDGSSTCSTPATTKSLDLMSRVVCNSYRSSRSTPDDDDFVKLDKISYQNMFQDMIGIKAMLLKLKRLLLESEGGLQENCRIYSDSGISNNVMEDELTDLRRQVLFLQQQLEEREKMVQVLRLKISQTTETGTVGPIPTGFPSLQNLSDYTGGLVFLENSEITSIDFFLGVVILTSLQILQVDCICHHSEEGEFRIKSLEEVLNLRQRSRPISVIVPFTLHDNLCGNGSPVE